MTPQRYESTPIRHNITRLIAKEYEAQNRTLNQSKTDNGSSIIFCLDQRFFCKPSIALDAGGRLAQAQGVLGLGISPRLRIVAQQQGVPRGVVTYTGDRKPQFGLTAARLYKNEHQLG
jgi:hypothetical protein